MSAAHQISAISVEALAEAIARGLGHGRERRSGETWTTYCPVHEPNGEGSPDLDVTVRDGKPLLHCQSRGCPQPEIIDALKERGLWPNRSERRRLTLAEFAAAKKLPVEFLQKCGVVQSESYHLPCLYFRYKLEDGSSAPRYRIRVALSGDKQFFWNKSEGAITAYGLDRLADAREKGVVVFVEGESDALTLWNYDIPAVGIPGAGTVNKLLTPDMVMGLPKIIVSQEPGEAGRKFASDIVARLKMLRWPCQVYIIDWSKTPYKDPSALHCAAPDAFVEEFKKLIKGAEAIDLTASIPQPVINIEEPLRDVRASAWAALKSANEASHIPILYRFAGGLVRVQDDDSGRAILHPVNEYTLRYELVNCSIWMKRKVEAAMPSRDQLLDLLETPNPPLPVLRRLVTVPVFAADGKLVDKGFHDGLLYLPDPRLKVPPVPTSPTDEEVLKAYNLISEMIAEFPFVHVADRAHAIALLVLYFARAMIDGPTPIHGFEAPKGRTGKGLLYESLLSIGVGTDYASYGPPASDEEVRKKITSALVGGAQVIVWDNVGNELGSKELASAVTKTFWEDRLLSKSKNVRVDPLTVGWVVTGNNLCFSDEMGPRVIRIRQDAKMADPENREFKIKNLAGWVKNNRPDLIWASLTLIQNWIAKKSKTPAAKPLGKFEEWTRVIGGILETSGISGFLDVRPSDAPGSSDREGFIWADFVTAWWKEHKGREVIPSELLETARAIDGFGLGETGTERGQITSLGMALAGHRDWTIVPLEPNPERPTMPSRLKIIFSGERGKRGYWQLLSVQ
jgi:hypothetical protein